MPGAADRIETFAGLERDRVAASRDRDLNRLSELLHPDFIFVHSNGRIDSRASYLDLLGSGALEYLSMQTRDIDVRSATEDVASVLSRIDLVADYLGKRLIVSALVLTTWVHAEGGWRALSIQSTPMPIEPASASTIPAGG